MRCLEKLNKRISDFSAVIVGNTGGMALDISHQAIEIIARIGDADDTDCGPVPEAGSIEFGDRDIKVSA